MSPSWPTRPTCHDRNPHAAHFGAHEWRPPRRRQDLGDPYDPTYRTCSYCGSIHPADLLDIAHGQGFRLEVADWKYGWPHKVYVAGIPNPIAGQLYRTYTYGPRDRIAEHAAPGYTPEGTPGGGWRVVSGVAVTPATLQTKWYNAHFQDLEGEAFDAVASLVERETGLRFELDDGRLWYQHAHHDPAR